MVRVARKQKLFSFRLFAVVFLLAAFFSVFLLNANTKAAPDVVPVSDKSLPLNLFEKGGKAKWLYYGNLRLEAKNGEQRDYALDPDTKKYVLEDAGKCSDDTPNDQIEVVDQAGRVALSRKVIVKDPDAIQIDCSNIKTLTTTNIGNKERKDQLFYQITDDPAEKDTIHMWNQGKIESDDGLFQKEVAAAGWKEVYTNKAVEGEGNCPDVIAKDAGDTWRFFPMTTWEWANGKHSYVENALSRPYANILGGGDTTYNTCRTLGAKIINDYRTGTINGEAFGDETKLRIKIGEDEGIDTNTVSICHNEYDDIGRELRFFEEPQLVENPHEKIQAVQDDFKIEYIDGTSKPPKGWYWVSHCEMTSKGSDNGYHTILLTADPGKYRMSKTSSYRLPVLSEQDVSLFAYDGTGDGKLDDGYTTYAGVAKITSGEVSNANPIERENPSNDDTTGDTDEKTSCAVDGIGWIVCPVMSFMAKMNDKAFGFLENLLTVRPALITDDGTKGAWGTFRDIANVAFVIAFLVIVYSQLTSVGISNYGIKRLLPKIIVAAILVNLSYFICALMVDLSNVVGSSIYGLLANVVEVESGPTGAGGGGPWETIVTVILAAAVGLLLFFIIFTSPFVLIALGIVLLILIARQAFVILLLVVSPLAFVAYLLPNTEDWFKKWWKAFTATLMVYPIVGAIFGASTLASNILMNVANNDDGDDKTLLQIVALTVLAVPLFAVPGVLKSSMAAAGTIGAKIQGLADRAQGRATRDVGKRSSEIAKNLGNRASSSLLKDRNTRWGRGLSHVGNLATGVRRRARREDAYKQNQALREADQENYLNKGIAGATNAAGQVDTSQLSKTARRRVEAGAAASTAKATNQLINNAGVQGSLAAHGQLYQKVAASDVATHHEQEYHKNQGEKEFYNNVQADPGRQAHYNELVKSREDRQAAETRANNQSKQDGEVRRAIRENKVAKGDEKIIDNEIELEHQESDTGRSQGQRTRDVEGKLEIERTSQDAAFAESTEGKTQTIAKDVQQQRKIIAESKNQESAVILNEDLRTEAGAAKAQLSAREAAVTAKAEQAFIESDEGRKVNLQAQFAKDSLEGAKIKESAIESELRAGGRDADGNLIQVDGLSDAEVEQFATDLSEADRTKRAQTQRGNAAKRVGDVTYAQDVKDSINKDGTAKPGGLAEVAGGIEGQAGVSQAAAVAQQTIIESFKKGVAAESTLLSSTDEGVILTGKDKAGNVVSSVSLDSPDILDQPDEKIAAMGSVIAKRQHMTSHIKLWKRMAELHNQADSELKAAEASGDPEAIAKAKARKDKVVNLQQQVMGDKSKKPFGIGDADQGSATVGEYGADIYKGTRDRILTHLSEASLSSMDPDDMRLIFEMARDGKLGPDHVKKIQETYKAWEKNPQLKHLLKDKTKALLDPIAKNDYSASPTDSQFDLSGL